MWTRACIALIVSIVSVLVAGCGGTSDDATGPDGLPADAFWVHVSSDDDGPAFDIDGSGLVLEPRDVSPGQLAEWPYVATARLSGAEIEQVRDVLDDAGLWGESSPEDAAEVEAADGGPVTAIAIESDSGLWTHRLVPGERLTALLADLDAVIDAAQQLPVPPPQVVITADERDAPTDATTDWPHPEVPLGDLRGSCILEGDLAVAVADTLAQATDSPTYVTYEHEGAVYEVYGGPRPDTAGEPTATGGLTSCLATS
ncbi:hypothetical protein GCM10023340_22320 [Nocardioides marinquilinus]|uniref:GerMN domain-containing protein n=1 Tax=Nocardioides marinquilinus TaxID=1210400 RepID=A0ABP9PPF5_9ACTN